MRAQAHAHAHGLYDCAVSLLKYTGPGGVTYERVLVADEVWAPISLEPGDVIEAQVNPDGRVFHPAPKGAKVTRHPDNAAPPAAVAEDQE
jgi:hypothetical protein